MADLAVLIPIRILGVMIEDGTYNQVIAWRAATLVNEMTANFFPFQHYILGKIANRIVNEVKMY